MDTSKLFAHTIAGCFVIFSNALFLPARLLRRKLLRTGCVINQYAISMPSAPSPPTISTICMLFCALIDPLVWSGRSFGEAFEPVWTEMCALVSLHTARSKPETVPPRSRTIAFGRQPMLPASSLCCNVAMTLAVDLTDSLWCGSEEEKELLTGTMLSSGSAQENCHSRIYPNVLDVMPTWPSDPLFMTKCVSMQFAALRMHVNFSVTTAPVETPPANSFHAANAPTDASCKCLIACTSRMSSAEERSPWSMMHNTQYPKCFEKYESRNNTFKVATLDE